MKKATKVIVSGLTGFALLTGGFVVGAQKNWEIWQGEDYIDQTETNIATLDRMLTDKEALVGDLETDRADLSLKIGTLQREKDHLDSEVSRLEGLQTRILDGAKALYESFYPGSSSTVTIERIADDLKENDGTVKQFVEAEFASLEKTLGLKPNGSYSKRLDAIQTKANDVVTELSSTKAKLTKTEKDLETAESNLEQTTTQLNVANSEVFRLEEELTKKGSDAEKLQAQLNAAEQDAKNVKKQSQDVINKHTK